MSRSSLFITNGTNGMKTRVFHVQSHEIQIMRGRVIRRSEIESISVTMPPPIAERNVFTSFVSRLISWPTGERW